MGLTIATYRSATRFFASTTDSILSKVLLWISAKFGIFRGCGVFVSKKECISKMFDFKV